MLARARPDLRGTCLLVLTVLAVFWALRVAAEVLLPVALSLMLMLLLAPLMRLLTRRLHLPRVLAALLVILALGCVAAGLVLAAEPQVSGWVHHAPEALARVQRSLQAPGGLLERVQHLTGPLGSATGGAAGGQNGAPPPAQGPARGLPDLGAMATGVGSLVLGGMRALVGQAFTTLLVLFFLLSSGDALLHRLIEVLPRFEDKKRAVSIAHEVEGNISRYLVIITAMNALVGTLNGLQAWAFGLPGPLLWGVVAFLLNFIPILGPLFGMVLFLVVGLLSLSNAWLALAPAGLYLLIHIMEGETITPMLLARHFTLNPLLVMLSLLFWDWMWGVPGAFLSVPLLAVFKIVCDHIETLTPLGHMLGATHVRPPRRGPEDELSAQKIE